MSDQTWLDGTLAVLKEAVEGGTPGQGTAFLDSTKADGSDNHGLLATLSGLNAAQASDPTALGLSVAAHAAHVAYHMEVIVRWQAGERGPFDWPGSFQPAVVDDEAWTTLQARVQAAYQGLLTLAGQQAEWDQDAAGGLVGGLAHVVYHLGAVRQTLKLIG
ncbi:DinB family protein [Deinococcus sonorensis]|uniref:DinB family protein n=2 Tax=Deinococcus sonorensis TaxID=309891 RepID=A0AAU7UEQ6_9DEIO